MQAFSLLIQPSYFINTSLAMLLCKILGGARLQHKNLKCFSLLNSKSWSHQIQFEMLRQKSVCKLVLGWLRSPETPCLNAQHHVLVPLVGQRGVITVQQEENFSTTNYIKFVQKVLPPSFTKKLLLLINKLNAKKYFKNSNRSNYTNKSGVQLTWVYIHINICT
jgi:hypothetical protein